ncbi:MAG: hypothetical protein ACXAC8_04975 [Candidatus Hodarchaeales archaeon]|jgi:hypothetical protein
MQFKRKTIEIVFKTILFITITLTLVQCTPALSFPNVSKNQSADNIIDIWDITINIFTVSVLLSEELPSIVDSGRNLFLIIVFGDGTDWESVVLFSYDAGANVTIHYMIGDPFTNPYFWVFQEEEIYSVYGQTIEITFLEYSMLNNNQTETAVLALTSLTSVKEFLSSFPKTIIDYSSSFTVSSPISFSYVPPSQISTIPASGSTQSHSSTPISSSSTQPPVYINISQTSKMTETSKDSESSRISETSQIGQISSGFEYFTFISICLLSYYVKKHIRREK